MASVDFQAFLVTMGFSAATRAFLALNGAFSSNELVRMSPKDLTLWVSQSARTSAPTRGANVEDGTFFSFFSLKACCSWSIHRSHCGPPLTEDAFTAELQRTLVDHCDTLAGETEFDDNLMNTKLLSFEDWPAWEELLLSAIRKMRNKQTNFNLECLTREERGVPASARSAACNSQIIARAKHSSLLSSCVTVGESQSAPDSWRMERR